MVKGYVVFRQKSSQDGCKRHIERVNIGGDVKYG